MVTFTKLGVDIFSGAGGEIDPGETQTWSTEVETAITDAILRPSTLRVRVVDTAGLSPATAYENGDIVDGVTLATGDVVLRATASGDILDGPYIAQATGAAIRHGSFPLYDDLPGVLFLIEEGTTNADSLWRCTSDRGGGTLGTNAIVFAESKTDLTQLYALPADPSADLREFMDLRYGEGQWTYRTGVGVGTDAGPAMDDALVALRTRYGRGELRITPGGKYLVTNPPSAANLSGNVIRGYGELASQVVLNNSSTTLFRFSGAGGFTGGGVHALGMFIEDGFGLTATSGAILLQGDATFQPDSVNLSDLNITAIGDSYWFNGVFANGIARTSPQGVRVADWSNIQQFSCRNVGVGLFNCVQFSLSNIGIYTGDGTGGDFFIGGGGAADTNSIQLDIRGLTCSNINATNATNVVLYGKTGQLQTNTSFDKYDIFLDVSVAQSGTLGPNGREVQI